jgi:hypothetical protein
LVIGDWVIIQEGLVIMDISRVFRSQYHAALRMMAQVIEACPDDLWLDTAESSPFWRVAYHALFYVHLYLQPTEADFVPWTKHYHEVQYLGKKDWREGLEGARPYTRQEVLDYLAFCHDQVDAIVPNLDFEGASGFSWLPFTKLETQIYNIRHLQGHVGELAHRLDVIGIETGWVGRVVLEEGA